MGKHIVYGVHLADRLKEATDVQKIFTDYGCNIKTRLGLHDVDSNFCATNGIILLEMCGDENKCEEMATKKNDDGTTSIDGKILTRLMVLKSLVEPRLNAEQLGSQPLKLTNALAKAVTDLHTDQPEVTKEEGKG